MISAIPASPFCVKGNTTEFRDEFRNSEYPPQEIEVLGSANAVSVEVAMLYLYILPDAQ